MDYLYDAQSIYNPLYNQQYSYINPNPQLASFYLNSNNYAQSASSPYIKSAEYQDNSLTNSSATCNNSTTLNSSLNSSFTSPTNQLLTQFSTPSSSSSASSTCSSLNNSSDFIGRNNSNTNTSPQYQFLASPISSYHHNYLSHAYHNQATSYPSHNIANLVNQEQTYLNSTKTERNETVKHVAHGSLPSQINKPIKKEETPLTTNQHNMNKYYENSQKSNFITPSLMSIEASQRRKRRQRTQFSKFQLSELEKLFLATRYPDIYSREDLSARIGIPESRIQVWFKNRRSKIRKNRDDKFDYKQMGQYPGEYLEDNQEHDDEDDNNERDLD